MVAVSASPSAQHGKATHTSQKSRKEGHHTDHFSSELMPKQSSCGGNNGGDGGNVGGHCINGVNKIIGYVSTGPAALSSLLPPSTYEVWLGHMGKAQDLCTTNSGVGMKTYVRTHTPSNPHHQTHTHSESRSLPVGGIPCTHSLALWSHGREREREPAQA